MNKKAFYKKRVFIIMTFFIVVLFLIITIGLIIQKVKRNSIQTQSIVSDDSVNDIDGSFSKENITSLDESLKVLDSLDTTALTDQSELANYNCSDLKLTNDNSKRIIPILYYHHVGLSYYTLNNKKVDDLAVENLNFDQQMKYLSDNNFTTMNMQSWLKYYNCGIPAPKKSVIITLDDGYTDFYTDALPILKKYNINAEIFLPTGLVNSNKFYLSWDMIKSINNEPLITIGSHTVFHKDLSTLSTSQASYEINQSKKDLEERLGKKINDFCYPYGSFSISVENQSLEAGYDLALTTQRTPYSWDGDLYKIPRLRISGKLNFEQFKKLLI